MTPTKLDDPEFVAAYEKLAGTKNFVRVIGDSIRQAIDDVLDGPRTRRYDLMASDVEKVEKTYVGTRIELLIIAALGVPRGRTLDMVIGDSEVDVKTTIGKTWMIPREAVGRLCLLVRSDDRAGKFAIGLLRTSLQYLTAGSNQDGKRNVSAEGKKAIAWFGESDSHGLPPNFLLQLSEPKRNAIMAGASGQIRVRDAFRICLEEPIPRSGLATIAKQLDPMKRVRDARKTLKLEGIYVLSSQRDKTRIREFLVSEPPGQYFISTRRTIGKI